MPDFSMDYQLWTAADFSHLFAVVDKDHLMVDEMWLNHVVLLFKQGLS
jgi:hypothetical protein